MTHRTSNVAFAALGLFAFLPHVAVDNDALEAAHETGAATILQEDVEQHLRWLAGPEARGRDSPSAGLDLACQYVIDRFQAAGIAAPERAPDYRQMFTMEVHRPIESQCKLELEGGVAFELGTDFVPLPLASGEAEGEVVFAGFGIQSSKYRYNDLKKTGVAGKIALIVEGEPEHNKKFDGPELTREAFLFRKLENLEKARAAGVLVVRRPVPGAASGADGEREGEGDAEAPTSPQQAFGFRHTAAVWNDSDNDIPGRSTDLPVLEITVAAADQILGASVLELVEQIEEKVRPIDAESTGTRVRMGSGSMRDPVPVPNVVGIIPGTDAALSSEWVVVGAHLDHVGVDYRGRIGFGADDNASGSAALIEIAEALAAAPPRRSVLLCAFGAEEDGLLGSAAIAEDPPVPRRDIVAMINLDMIGRGPTTTVAVLGVKENPGYAKILDRARKYSKTGVRKVEWKKSPQHLFARSDHYSFHQVGIPALFLFEDPKGEQENEDYHTWRDTIEALDVEKITFTSRFAYNLAWLIATDDELPERR